MIDGKYAVVLKTPLGAKKGKLILKSEEDKLTGTMLALGSKEEIQNGKVSDNHFSFEGSFKTALGKLDYQAEGSYKNNSLLGVAKTKKGNFALKGTLVE